MSANTNIDKSHDDDNEYQEEDGPVDFLQSMKMTGESDTNDNDNGQDVMHTKPRAESTHDDDEPHYNPKKPLWWKKISRRPTKAQKRSIEAMAMFRLPRMEWGQFMDWDSVFSSTNSKDNADSHPNNDTTNTENSKDSHPPETRRDIWLEIGFGTGDNLLALAQKYPQKCFVGAEVHTSGIGKLCQRMHHACLQNDYWSGYAEYSEELRKIGPSNLPEDPKEDEDEELDIPTDAPIPDFSTSTSPYSNLRTYGGDGVKLLPYIPTSSLAAILITFPDPFEKKKQRQYRVIQTHTLMEFYRILQPQGRLFVATDHEGYYQWCHEKVNQVNNDDNVVDKKNSIEEASPKQSCDTERKLFTVVEDLDRTEWLPVISKYEQKGWNEGRTTHLSCWQVSKI